LFGLEHIETVYDMSVSCFQLITSMKLVWLYLLASSWESLWKELILCFVIEIAYT